MKKHTQFRPLNFESLENRELPSVTPLAGAFADQLGPTEMVAQSIPYGTGLPGSDLNSWGTGNLPWWTSDFLVNGDGNTYVLTETGDSIGRVVWLFAMYYGNQERTVPGQTTPAVARTEEKWDANYGLFGTKLSSVVYYDEYPDAARTPRTPKDLLDEAAPQPGKTPTEQKNQENRLERRLEPELERQLNEMLKPEENLKKGQDQEEEKDGDEKRLDPDQLPDSPYLRERARDSLFEEAPGEKTTGFRFFSRSLT